jgi:hypothetical protein
MPVMFIYFGSQSSGISSIDLVLFRYISRHADDPFPSQEDDMIDVGLMAICTTVLLIFVVRARHANSSAALACAQLIPRRLRGPSHRIT